MHVDVVDDLTVRHSVDDVGRDHDVIDPVKPAITFVGVCRPVSLANGVHGGQLVLHEVSMKKSASSVFLLWVPVVSDAAGSLVTCRAVGVNQDVVDAVCLGVVLEIFPPRSACVVGRI